MKHTPMGSGQYSAAHPSIFNAESKRRIANQAIHVIKSFMGNQNRRPLSTLSCLDIACGAGITSREFSSIFHSVTGVDIDGDAIKFAKRSFQKKNLRFIQGDATNLPLPNNHFDVVICQEVYSYVADPATLMQEIYRILKPGGICYFAGDNLLFPIELQYKIPFLLYAPDTLAIWILKLLGHRTYYLGHYKTYRALRRLCKNFIAHDYTLRILRSPEKYQFIRLYKYKRIANWFPNWFLTIVKFFLPTFILILQKPT